MRQMCVRCVIRSAPPSQFVVSATSFIVTNALMPTLVGNKLFISQYMMDADCCYFDLCSALSGESLRSTLVDLGGSSGGGEVRG